MAWVSDVVFSALIIASGVLTASTVGFAVAWVRARERAIRAIRAEQRIAPEPAGDARFDRLEHAVESIAVEVERMAEGQRFVTRVLAERGSDEEEPSGRRARVATPH